MPIHVDFTNTKGFEPLPSGIYVCSVTEVEERQGPNAPYIHWRFTVEEGEFTGRHVWYNTTLKDDALFALRGLLNALSEEPTPDGPFSFDPTDYLGKLCRVTVELSTYNGKPVNNVKEVKLY